VVYLLLFVLCCSCHALVGVVFGVDHVVGVRGLIFLLLKKLH
jgi:hypothetical protein